MIARRGERRAADRCAEHELGQIVGVQPPIYTVRDFMTARPCAVDSQLRLRDAVDRMAANNIRHLLVVDDDVLVGVVSSRDLALASAIAGDDALVRTAMSPYVYACGPETPLQQAAHEMEQHRDACAVVVDSGEAIGILTTTDALYALRWVLAGRPVARAVLPTHEVPHHRARERVDHFVRVSSSVQSHAAGPSPNIGNIHHLGVQ